MNREDLQTLADLRIIDADVLLSNNRFSAAYYLLGYSVECALKACIAKQFKEHDFPDKRLVKESYTHNLADLIKLSGLKIEFDRRIESDKDFELAWAIVVKWTEESRYDNNITEVKARDFLNAVKDPNHGFLPWLKEKW